MLYDGAPDHPGPDRLWAFVERHRISHCGVSPTLIRALMAHGDSPSAKHDLSGLRILASTGEPWNEDPWRWYFERVGGGRCPVINICGGTEVGVLPLPARGRSRSPVLARRSERSAWRSTCSTTHGQPVRGVVGELVCTKPWPGMTRGMCQDPERYLDTYWSRWPDVWVHGDWARRDRRPTASGSSTAGRTTRSSSPASGCPA